MVDKLVHVAGLLNLVLLVRAWIYIIIHLKKPGSDTQCGLAYKEVEFEEEMSWDRRGKAKRMVMEKEEEHEEDDTSDDDIR